VVLVVAGMLLLLLLSVSRARLRGGSMVGSLPEVAIGIVILRGMVTEEWLMDDRGGDYE